MSEQLDQLSPGVSGAVQQISGDAVDKIADLVPRPQLLRLEDAEVLMVPEGFTALPADKFRAEPSPPVLQLHTLTGLVDYLRANVDDQDSTCLLLRVVSPTKVELVSAIYGATKQRDVLAVVDCEPLVGRPFGFGQWMDLETFNIALQSMFVDLGDRAAVLKLVGSVKAEGVRTVDDNGVTQAVTAKAGVVLSSEVRVPNPVTMAPYRTFREIAQPSSQFVFRLRGGGDGALPHAALFEADGAEWKLASVGRIASFLRQSLQDTGMAGIAILA